MNTKGSDKLGLLNKIKDVKNSKNNKNNNKIKEALKKHLTAVLVSTGIKIIPLLLVIAIVTSIIEWVIKIFQPKNTVNQIYKGLEIDDLYDLIEIKGNDADGYYLDFADGIDEKLDETIKYLDSTAGVKSGIDKEFFKKTIKAEVCTQFPDLGGQVNGDTGFQGVVDILRITPNKEINELKNTGVGEETIVAQNEINDIETTDENGNTGSFEIIYKKIVDTIDSNVRKLTYVPKKTFDSYVSNSSEEALYHFTLDDDGNLITATWSVNEDNTLEITNNSAINLKTALQNYILPCAYLMYFYMEADYEGFSNDLANVALNSEIIIALEDNVTTTNVIKTTEEKKVSESEKYSYDWKEIEQKDITTEYCSTNIEIIYADTWCVKLINKDLYTEELLSVGAGQSKNMNISGTVTEEKTKAISAEAESGSGSDSEEVTATEIDANGKVKEKKDTKYYSYKLYQRVITDTLSIENSYASSSKEIQPESKEKVFIDLYNNHKMYNRVNDKRFLQILENDSKTANLVNLTKYLMYKATGIVYDDITEYDFSEYEDISFNPTGSAGGSLSLTTPTLDKKTFVKALKEYANSGANSSFKTNFLPYASEIYEWSVAAGVNPELVIITAKSEGQFGETGGSFNYWGIAVYNGEETGNSYSSLKEGIEGYAQVIASYRTGWKKNVIEDKAKKRAAAGADPLGYGTPDSFSGMQSLYSSLGKHVTGSDDEGGYYYMDPAVANVTKIYATHAEFLKKCKDSGLAEHAYGTDVTDWEDGQYTAWQVEQKLASWNQIFGKYGTLTSGGNEDIVETAKTKLGCPYVWGAKGPNSFDCSGFVWWVYNQKGISVPGYTGGYKSYAGSPKEISWDQAQPGDILIVFDTERTINVGHAGIYLGEDSYIHAPTEGDVVKIEKSGAKSCFKHVFRFY